MPPRPKNRQPSSKFNKSGRRPVRKQDFREGEFASDLEAIFARELLSAIAKLRRAVTTAEVEAAIRQSVTEAVRALDAVFAETDITNLVSSMTNEIIRAGLEQGPELARNNQISMRFDVADPRAQAWARDRAGLLIRNISDEIRVKVGSVTERLLAGDISLREARNEISRSVGLHDRWQKAVDNSYEQTLEQLLEAGIDIDEAELLAQEAADNYAQRLLKTRASNIARTELATAQNQGRYIHWQQLAEAGVIDPSVTVKEWRTAPEFVSSKTEVCPICEPMDGIQAPLWGEFPEVDVIMPPAHPNCRCRAVLIVQPIEDVIDYVEAQREELGY